MSMNKPPEHLVNYSVDYALSRFGETKDPKYQKYLDFMKRDVKVAYKSLKKIRNQYP